MSKDPYEDARLTAVALVRAILNEDEVAYGVLLGTTSEVRDLAQAACGLAAAALAVLPDDVARHALDAFTAASVAGQE